jgi:hypothetical protein
VVKEIQQFKKFSESKPHDLVSYTGDISRIFPISLYKISIDF